MRTVEEKFWAAVIKTAGCWQWAGTKGKDGYGQLPAPSANTTLRAHRVSWEIHFGPIPEGLLVCHHCDTTECTNPGHLFLGTQQDNADDMVRKGRWLGRGFRKAPPNPYRSRGRIGSRLEEHLPDISARRDNGETLSEIAASFGCDKRVIMRLLDRNGLYIPIKPGPRVPHNARTAEVRKHLPEILERRNNGETINALAKCFGTGRLTMTKLIRTASIAAREEDICNPRDA